MGSNGTETKFTAKEWNAAGAFHFYGSRKPRSFIVEVYTTEKIDGRFLQVSVDRALERLPYYGQTFVRKKGMYYYADNTLPFEVAESEKARSVGGKNTNYHMIDVNYHDNLIRFSMFHGLCDGLGLNRFIETTLYNYFCLKDGKQYSDDGIFTSKVPYDPAEEFDAFEKESKVDTKELKKLANGEVRFRLSEVEANKGPLIHRFPVRIKTEELLSWSKASSASPSTAIAAILNKVILAENTVNEGVIMCVVPFSLRKYLHAAKTYKNCASAIFIPSKPEEIRSMTVGELAGKLRTDMKKEMNEEWALLLSASVNMLTHLGKKMPFYFLKNKILSIPENKPQDTYTIDYVGSLKTNDYSDQITEVRYLNPDVYKGSMSVVLSETAGYFHINFNQTFGESRYYDGFLKMLDEIGIPYDKLPADTYLNPEVELPEEQR